MARRLQAGFTRMLLLAGELLEEAFAVCYTDEKSVMNPTRTLHRRIK